MLETTRRLALKLVGGGTASVIGSGAVAGRKSASDETREGQEQDSRVLPPPQQVLREAEREGERTASADLSEPGLNVVLPEIADDPEVQRTNEGYAGADAGDLGRLAAAVAVAEDDVRLHYPDADSTAAGPWVVLEPLSGQLSTVQRGVGRVQVTMDYRESSGDDAEFTDCLTEVRAASDLSHPYYPVDRAVFTNGMMNYTLAGVETSAESLTATFTVTTTPATSAGRVESQFDSLDCVRDVSYASFDDVERADPSPRLRDAVEQAHRSVLGVATYEWGSSPTVFSELPENKIAFGLGSGGATEFSNDEYAACVGILSESVQNVGDAE